MQPIIKPEVSPSAAIPLSATNVILNLQMAETKETLAVQIYAALHPTRRQYCRRYS
jgi:hypothetical protein